MSIRVNENISSQHRKFRKNFDDKSNILNEVIENIRAIKMNSWDDMFATKINHIKKLEYYNSLIGRLFWVPHFIAHWVTYYSMIIGVFTI